MFVVYVRSWAWGAWGRSARWNQYGRFYDLDEARACAEEVDGLLVAERSVSAEFEDPTFAYSEA